MPLFHGLSAFPLTPTDAAGEVQALVLARILDRLLAAGVDSIGLLGSTGGYAYLSRDQRRAAVQAAAAHLAGRIPLIVGVGALRTDSAVALAEDAAAAGADGPLLAPMSYTPLTEAEVLRHFETVAAATPLPLCIYNNPGTTHFTFTPDLILRLAAIPRIVAVKMPLPADGDLAGELARLRDRAPEGFSIGYSGDWGAADALLAGCDAWFSVVAGLLPAPALALTRAAQRGDRAEAARIDAAFGPLWQLFRAFGSFRVMHGMAARLGLGALAPPLPVLPLPDTEGPRVEASLQAIAALG